MDGPLRWSTYRRSLVGPRMFLLDTALKNFHEKWLILDNIKNIIQRIVSALAPRQNDAYIMSTHSNIRTASLEFLSSKEREGRGCPSHALHSSSIQNAGQVSNNICIVPAVTRSEKHNFFDNSHKLLYCIGFMRCSMRTDFFYLVFNGVLPHVRIIGTCEIDLSFAERKRTIDWLLTANQVICFCCTDSRLLARCRHFLFASGGLPGTRNFNDRIFFFISRWV